MSLAQTALCKQNDVYTWLVGGKRDYSFESSNNDIESALSRVLTELRAGVDLNREGAPTWVFTHLAVFTVNLIARSRVLRKHMDGSLDRMKRRGTNQATCVVKEGVSLPRKSRAR